MTVFMYKSIITAQANNKHPFFKMAHFISLLLPVPKSKSIAIVILPCSQFN